MGIFLTEQERTTPLNRQKPKPKHPWRASIKADTQAGKQPSQPAHLGYDEGESWHHSAGMAEGCGLTLPRHSSYNQ